MSYNLNFYPNENKVNPYLDNLNNLYQNAVQNLQQFNNQYTPQNVQKENEQAYYLYCGKKDDWQEFLSINYGITEEQIFDDYKLYLQAKQEILQEQGQNKINNMKDKIKSGVGVNIDNAIKSDIKPNNMELNIESNNQRSKQTSNKKKGE